MENIHHSTSNKKSEVFNLRASSADRYIITSAAKIANQTVTDFILEAARNEAEKTLLDKKIFNLDSASYKNFIKLLDNPVESNKALHKLLNKKPIWE